MQEINGWFGQENLFLKDFCMRNLKIKLPMKLLRLLLATSTSSGFFILAYPWVILLLLAGFSHIIHLYVAMEHWGGRPKIAWNHRCLQPTTPPSSYPNPSRHCTSEWVTRSPIELSWTAKNRSLSLYWAGHVLFSNCADFIIFCIRFINFF